LPLSFEGKWRLLAMYEVGLKEIPPEDDKIP
jgi:hypothetical protein